MLSAWPVYDPALAREEMATVVVQINGKVRDKFEAVARPSRGRARGGRARPAQGRRRPWAAGRPARSSRPEQARQHRQLRTRERAADDGTNTRAGCRRRRSRPSSPLPPLSSPPPAAATVCAGRGSSLPARDHDRERADVQEPDDALRARRQADPGRHRRARRPGPGPDRLGRRTPRTPCSTGEITGFSAKPLAFTAGQPGRPLQHPRDGRVVLRERTPAKILFSNPSFVYQEEYEVPTGSELRVRGNRGHRQDRREVRPEPRHQHARGFLTWRARGRPLRRAPRRILLLRRGALSGRGRRRPPAAPESLLRRGDPPDVPPRRDEVARRSGRGPDVALPVRAVAGRRRPLPRKKPAPARARTSRRGRGGGPGHALPHRPRPEDPPGLFRRPARRAPSSSSSGPAATRRTTPSSASSRPCPRRPSRSRR